MIQDLRLQHFRSYTDDTFEFDPSVNIIVGPNASGKTNLLESVQVLCLGHSYRARDNDLIQYEQAWGRLDAHIDELARTVKLIRGEANRAQKEYNLGGKVVKQLALTQTIPLVLFEPNHLLLLAGQPELRRDYIDNLLEQMFTGFGPLRRQYKRALLQRNTLLKQFPRASTDQLFVWNIRLSELGGHIVEQRLKLIDQLDKEISSLYSQLAHHSNTVTLQYQSDCDDAQYSSDLLHKLEHSIDKDIARGFTSYGPHRDDLQITLNNKPLANNASRGESRTLLLAFKVLELQLLEKERNERPVLLLDDVFSELDGSRRRALTELLSPYQTFITTTDADVVIQHFSQSTNLIPISTT